MIFVLMIVNNIFVSSLRRPRISPCQIHSCPFPLSKFDVNLSPDRHLPQLRFGRTFETRANPAMGVF